MDNQNNQKVKLQISSDIEDVTKVSSVLLEEALLHIKDLTDLINTGKDLLRTFNISDPNDLEKLKASLHFIASTRLPLSKVDNRLGDVVAVVDGLYKILTGTVPNQEEKKEEPKNDTVVAG